MLLCCRLLGHRWGDRRFPVGAGVRVYPGLFAVYCRRCGYGEIRPGQPQRGPVET